MTPVVSVIMPALNAADCLPRAVASVIAQTHPDWELLIVDDGSKDATGAVAQDLARDEPRVRVLTQPAQSGAARARNRALDVARGRYIAFLDADDAWDPAKLEQQIAFMEQTGTAFSYTGFWRQKGTRCHLVQVPEHVTYDTLLKGNVIGCLTAVYDTEVFGKVPMPPLTLRQDYALWLTLLRRVPEARGLTEPLAINHKQRQSLSSGPVRSSLATWKMYRDVAGLSAFGASWHLASHITRRLWRG